MQEPSRVGISKMFDGIASTYDRVNRVMTFCLDQYWRRKMIPHLPPGQSLTVLDCATGTGDQLICLMEGCSRITQGIGIDLAEEMLALARKKTSDNRISFQKACALQLPFPDQSFDVVTISFGIRNVTDVKRALAEFHRVLKPSGRLMILEGTVPFNRILKSVHLFYLRHLLPRIGGWISKDKNAYRYLNQTIETFPAGEEFCKLLTEAGFNSARAYPLTGGAVTLYTGDKRS